MIFFILKIFIAAAFGLGFKLFKKSQSLEATATAANISYVGFKTFLKNNFMLILGTFMTIMAIVLLVGDGLNPENWGVDDKTVHIGVGSVGVTLPMISVVKTIVLVGFMTAGWMGIDIALMFFSKTATKINDKIDNITGKPQGPLTPMQ